MSRAALFVAAVCVCAYGSYGCAGESSTTSEAPSDHTVSEQGVMHAAGLEAPLTNCVSCHGASLEGDEGPSCTSCHGVRW